MSINFPDYQKCANALPVPGISLNDICNEVKKDGWPDKNDPHSYIDVYADLFHTMFWKPKKILEIGLFNGASLRMWEKYFVNSDVHGIDSSETPLSGTADLRPMIASGEHNIHIFDATDEQEVEKRFSGVRFDVIIEDAQHTVEQQLQLYNVWKRYLAKGAVYVIEDVQDLDRDRHLFEAIDPEKTVEIVDLRKVKNRYDDCLVIIR